MSAQSNTPGNWPLEVRNSLTNVNEIMSLTLNRCPSCEVEATVPSVIADKAFDELIEKSEVWEQKFVDENMKNETLVKTVEEANARIQQLQSEIAELKKLQEAED